MGGIGLCFILQDCFTCNAEETVLKSEIERSICKGCVSCETCSPQIPALFHVKRRVVLWNWIRKGRVLVEKARQKWYIDFKRP
ncbi:hypothetical protein EI42_05243 [Thermosporothrix hazakensis]|uniref:Uncharacterized protein n=1 Tax=Thermosporothrix hazakensis TaxID=644383 RepID=A0A326TZJ3_THEHA|nr:hypothetical protein EI42_05243 [Thermosporothrix hazakensis]